MCPICWATALASFAVLIAISMLTVAGTDKWCLAIAVAMGISAIIHRLEFGQLTWWWFAALMAVAVVRTVYLLIARRDELLIYNAWQRGRQIAARRCPARQIKGG